MKLLLDYIFDEMKYEKILLDTNIKNKRAQRVYEQLNFIKTGIRVNSWKNQLGEPQTTVDYLLENKKKHE